MVDPHVVKITKIKSIVCCKSASVDNAIWFYFILNDGQEGFSFCKSNDGCKNLPTPLQ